MDELPILIFLIVVVLVTLTAIVLPIIALIISIRSERRLNKQLSKLEVQGSSLVGVVPKQLPISGDASLASAIQQLQERIEKLEAAMTASSVPIAEAIDERAKTVTEQIAKPADASPTPYVDRIEETPLEAQPSSPFVPDIAPELTPISPAPPPSEVASVPSSPGPTRKIQSEQIESIIGRRGLGWAAVCLILFAAAFFLKYAFDNRWIGELGRVAIGVAAGAGMTLFGFKYHKRGWRVFSQILTGGGIVLLYLSAYAAFGYYHLASQKVAFVYLAILVAEAACLALLYNAPAIAIMALIGGFLNPILLHSDRDQYRSLFGYIAMLDIGALALLKHWKGLTSLAFAGTHLLFWLWYVDSYHPQKLGAVMIFQTAVFFIFLLAHVGRHLVGRQSLTFEDLGLLAINPFIFFATAYYLLNPDYHNWMGVFAVGMALLYAGAVKILLDRSAATKSESLSMIGVALTFVTIAIPIQLSQNWITIGWSVEALLMLWAGLETRAGKLRAAAFTLFGLVLIRLVFWDTPQLPRPMFIPVLNKYFLSSVVVTVCLFGAAALYQRVGQRRRREQEAGAGGRSSSKQIPGAALWLAFTMVGIATLWFIMSIETYTFFAARAAVRKLSEDASHELWLGQMALSVLWSVYAGALAAIGFIRRSASIRWASLALFGLTIVKVMLVDIAELHQFYRIIAFFVLGVLLLVVAWGYHKAFYSRESST